MIDTLLLRETLDTPPYRPGATGIRRVCLQGVADWSSSFPCSRPLLSATRPGREQRGFSGRGSGDLRVLHRDTGPGEDPGGLGAALLVGRPGGFLLLLRAAGQVDSSLRASSDRPVAWGRTQRLCLTQLGFSLSLLRTHRKGVRSFVLSRSGLVPGFLDFFSSK